MDPLLPRVSGCRGYYKGVIPGFHMNKRHWNTVLLNANVPDEEVHELIAHSFELTRPKKQTADHKRTENQELF